MKTLDLHGIFVAIATPYRQDESLDEEGLRRLVRHLLPDVHGFVVKRDDGGFPFAHPRGTAARAGDRRRRGRRAETGHCRDGGHRHPRGHRSDPRRTGSGGGCGPDHRALPPAALIIAPYHLRPSAAGLRQHFSDVAAAAPDLPILLYNFPQLVGQIIPIEVIAGLHATAPNIIGMKDTSGDLIYLLTVLETLPEAFSVLAGRGTVVLPALAAGAVGAILACANLIPAQWQAVFQAARRGDWATARAGQYAAQRVSRLVGKGGSLTVRVGLEMQGIPMGPPRRPLTAEGVLSERDLDALRELLPA